MSFRAAVTGLVVALGIVALVGIGFAARATPGAAREAFFLATPAAAVVVAQPEGGAAAPASDEVGADGDVTPVATELASEPAEPVAQQPTTAATTQPAPVSGDQSAQGVQPGAGEPRVDGGWVAATSSATGIPARALQAYGDATVRLAVEDPGCRLGWNTLAGIGLIESGHGRAGLQDDGHPAAPIVGPALDGSPGRAAIRATAESSAWHGDPTWDHAVGPMQFIPSTWYRWGADGDGDGVTDPQDIDDAALAAARYLCAGSRDLTTADGWWAAVLSYNHSDDYATKVLSAANAYAVAAG